MNDRLCIVVPYRNRLPHIQKFLPHYRRLLPGAKFIIVEQSQNKEFNAFMLQNIGAKIMWDEVDYFCFHDIDMIVQGTPDYSYPTTPTHCATHASQFGWKMPFDSYMGGVVLFNKADLKLCNGYSNRFYSWAGGDNEMYYRVNKVGLQVTRRPHRYLSLPHPKRHPTGFDPVRQKQAEQDRAPDDGLNNLKFEIVGEREIQNGKIITVEI